MSKKADTKKEVTSKTTKDRDLNKSEDSKDEQKPPAKLPKGNVFDYAADQIAKFEKKHRAPKQAKLQEKLQEIKSVARNKSPDRGLLENSSIQEERKDKKEKPKKEDTKKNK